MTLTCIFYLEPNKVSFEKACSQIAAESSIGTWTKLTTMKPGMARLRPDIEINKKTNTVEISYPDDLFEAGNMPEIFSSIGGNIFGMKAVKNLRLLDIEFPKKIIKSFKGPKFGIKGIRKLLKVNKRPLIGTIVKPKLGLNEKEHAKVAYEAWVGGLDIVKDDENLTSMTFNKFNKRVIETLKMRDKAEKETGEKKMYMPNVTAETQEMLKRADFVKKNHGEYIMVDIITTGWSALQTLRNHNDKLNCIMHAHRAGHGAFTKNKRHGISMLVVAKAARLIGVDQLHIGTASVGKMEETSLEAIELEDEIESNLILENELGHVLEQRWYGVKPVFAVASGGLWAGSVPKLINIMGNNIIMQFGGGVHGHPNGTRAGAASIRQALEAAMQGISLKTYAKNHDELKRALETWK